MDDPFGPPIVPVMVRLSVGGSSVVIGECLIRTVDLDVPPTELEPSDLRAQLAEFLEHAADELRTPTF